MLLFAFKDDASRAEVRMCYLKTRNFALHLDAKFHPEAILGKDCDAKSTSTSPRFLIPLLINFSFKFLLSTNMPFITEEKSRKNAREARISFVWCSTLKRISRKHFLNFALRLTDPWRGTSWEWRLKGCKLRSGEACLWRVEDDSAKGGVIYDSNYDIEFPHHRATIPNHA